MKLRLTTILLLVGLALGLGPWLMIEAPGYWWYWVSIAGGLMVAFAGYDSQAKMLGMGEPGEELLQKYWKLLKQKLTRW